MKEALIEAIRLYLAYASFKDFVVYQMDVKSAFLYGKIKEEVYVCQPPSFEDLDFPDKRGQIDMTLFIKKDKSNILLVQVHVDNIMFGSTRKEICTEFEKMMHKKFQMSSIGELTFFFGLQVKQKEDRIFISQDKIFRYLKGQPKLGLWYPKDSPFDLVACTDSDYARASLDRKPTIGGYQFLGCRLISWKCKEQTVVANSTTEAEYIAAPNSCGQVLWIQNQMLDYGFNYMHTKIYIDNESTICIVKNPIFHSKTKHIEIRHHFIRDSNEKKLIQMIKFHTDHNVADFLTKAFDVNCVNMEQIIHKGWLEWNATAVRDEIRSTGVVKKVNREPHVHALIDGKRIVVSEATIRNLDTKAVKFLMYPRFIQLFMNHQVEGLLSHKIKYIAPSYTKKFFGNMKRVGKDFSGNVTTLFPTMLDMVADEDVIVERVTKQSNDPLSGEDRLKLQELMEICPNLQRRVLTLEETKTTQAAEIIILKKWVKMLEKGKKTRTPKLKRLYKGRKIADIDKYANITLVDRDQGKNDDNIMFDINDLARDEVVGESKSTSKDVNLNEDEVTLAQTLQKMKSTTPRAKGVVMREREQETKRLQAQFDEEAKIANEEALTTKEANLALTEEWNNIQAKIDVDYELAQRLLAEEQEELTDAEKAKLFIQLLEARKKHFAAKRAKEQRSKPPTKAQKRKTTSTYLKNMAGYKANQLKNKSYDDIQMLFDKAMKRVNTFVDMDTEVVEGSFSKRAGDELRQETIKKKKLDDDKETTELQMLVEIIIDAEEVAVDAIPLPINP
ncbi:putative ribonuclease H-like domain-containing protein [Tanacetum coccineum]